MTSRRKTKTERELVADINKAFQIFCKQQDCHDCPYKDAYECRVEYLIDLLLIHDNNDN